MTGLSWATSNGSRPADWVRGAIRLPPLGAEGIDS